MSMSAGYQVCHLFKKSPDQLGFPVLKFQGKAETSQICEYWTLQHLKSIITSNIAYVMIVSDMLQLNE